MITKLYTRKLTDEFFFCFGPPEQLHSDQGHNFEADVVAEMCRLLGVVKTRTTPYHPQSDGLVEQLNRTLLNMLATAVDNEPSNWDSHVRRLCIAYNSSIHLTTGYTPFYLMFGRQVRMLVDLMYGTPNPDLTTTSGYAAELKKNLENAYQQVRGRMKHKLKQVKELYDMRVHGQPLNQEIWCGCIAQQCLEGYLKNFTNRGKDPSMLLNEYQM